MNKFIEINGTHFNLFHIISIKANKDTRTGYPMLTIKFSNGETEKIICQEANDIISKLNM